MKTKNRLLLVLTLLISSLLWPGLVGCSSEPTTSVKIVMAPYFGSWLCTYGVMSGEITSDLVNVEIDQSLRFDDQMMAGNYPIGVMNTGAFAIATQQKPGELKALGVYLAHTGLEASSGVAMLYTLASSSLVTPGDLVGKNVGVPGLNSGITSTFLGMLKSEYGIEESELRLVDKPVTQLPGLLRQGDIDACVMLGDPSVEAYYAHDLRVLWNIDQAFEQKYGTYNPASFLVVKTEYLEENPEVVRDVYDLLVRSREYGEEHLAELSETYTAEFSGDAEFYQNAYLHHYSVTFDKVENSLEDSVMTIFGFIKDRGIISEYPEPSDIFVEW